jgi:invasion protein IalB
MPLAKLSPNARAKAVLSPPPAMPRRPRAARLSSLVHELVTRFRQVFFNVDRRRGASGAASRRRIMNLRVLTIAAIAVIGASAGASAQQEVGVFKAWKAFTQDDPDGKLCFVASQPTDSKYSQKISDRDAAFFMITSIPAKSIRNEASTIIGYPFAPNSTVTVDIDGKKFSMFTNESQGDTAWAVVEQQEALVAAMKSGTRMTVEGKSRRGTISTDSYSLSGVTAALDKATAECP